MTKRDDKKFRRLERDSYDTPESAVQPLLKYLGDDTTYCEPCAGKGKLISSLKSYDCKVAYDIAPRNSGIIKRDALTLTCMDLHGADYIITNPPWDRELLHPMIEHFRKLAPTWLLFDSDWMHTLQAEWMLLYCRKIVSVGRVSWMENGVSGFDNCAWYLFVDYPTITFFHGREK